MYHHKLESHQAENQKALLVVFIYGPNIHFKEPTWPFHSIDSLSLVLMRLKELASDTSSGFLP